MSGASSAQVVDSAGLKRLTAHPTVTRQATQMAREHRFTLQTSLQRGLPYLPIIEREFRREGVPMGLAYLPIIESHFRADAMGRGTGGLWQFTTGTARLYGLTVNGRVDERRDPAKSSRAAARLLRDLHDEFGSWGLALAAYNAGSGRVQQALVGRPRANFFELAERGLLPAITRHYVPKVLAVALIGSSPESFGLKSPDRRFDSKKI